MSLQQFQQAASAEGASTPSRPSAWGQVPGTGGRATAGGAKPGAAASSGLPVRATEEPKRSAWAKGPPPSAVEALWAAPAAVPDHAIDASAWDEPVEVAPAVNDWGDGTRAAGDWQEGEEAVAPGSWEEEPDLGSATTAPSTLGAKLLSASSASVPEAEAEADIAQEVAAWLRELGLSEHQGAVLAWCEKMGAASLDEVMDSLEELAEAVELKPLQRKRLLKQGKDLQSFYTEHNPPVHEEEDLQSFYSEHNLPVQEEEDMYLKQTPTEKATWEPTVKVTQAARKKQQQQKSKAGPSLEEDDDEEAQRRADAARRLQEQLAGERARAQAEMLEVLRRAAGEGEAEAFRVALETARAVGAAAEDLREAERTLERTLKTRKRLREEALCALQAVVEAPRDEHFGKTVRAALEAALGSRDLEGHAAAAADAEAALRDWEAIQQLRGEAKMGLQIAVRRGEVKILQMALEEARGAGLTASDNAEGRLVVEAQERLRQALARERAAAEATERLRQAMESEDIDELEEAVEACRELHLPLSGAEPLLHRLREEAEHREEAAWRLREAMEGQDTAAIRAAMGEARGARVAPALLERAEAAAEAAEVAAKRRQNASVELHLARRAKEIRRLDVAIAEARTLGVEAATLEAAEGELEELLAAERRRKDALVALDSARHARHLVPLRAALEAAEVMQLSGSSEVAAARALLEELEEEARLAEAERARRVAEEDLRAAVARADWDAIVAGQERARSLCCPADGEVFRLAESVLEQLRDAHELEEAEQVVRETNARLADLKKREAALSGATHKKERSAIGKLILATRNKEEYLSAMRFLRSPEEERRRRQDRALELRRQAEEERAAQEQRRREVLVELSSALDKRDEDAVRALLVEDALARQDVEVAEAFLADLEARRAAAEKDAALCEFCFAGLERRAFFTVAVGMNEFLTDQYHMQEGTDFKLKVVKASNSVLVAFRSAEIAGTVRSTARALAEALGAERSASVVASAVIREPGNFSEGSEDSLADVRKEAEALLHREQRPEAEQAVRDALRTAVRRSGGAAAEGEAGATAHAATGSSPAVPSAAGRGRGGAGRGGGSAWGTGARTAPTRTMSMEAQAPSGAGGSWGSSSPLQATRSVPSPGCEASTPGGAASSAYPAWGGASVRGGGAGGRGGSSRGAGEGGDTIPLPPRAAAMLQRDRETAATFHGDLRTFASRYRVQAELRGLDAVVLKPMGFVHKDAMQKARVELQGLLDYYFPERRDAAVAVPGASVAAAVPKSPAAGRPTRHVRLRVDADAGAGIEITPTAEGYRVDHVEDCPGQDFSVGNIIIEIAGRSLEGLSEEDMEDAFGEGFGDGASLVLL